MVTFWKDLKLRERIDRLLLRRKNSPKVNGTAIEPAASGTTAKREKSGGELSHPKSSGMSNRLDSDKHEIQVWEVKEVSACFFMQRKIVDDLVLLYHKFSFKMLSLMRL